MATAAQSPIALPAADPVQRWLDRRATIEYPPPGGYPKRAAANRANSLLSTGPRSAAGKQRSSLNALSHGLTAASPVLPTEDRAAYEQHRAKFFDEYKPATPTESQLVQELVDTSWRLNRIPLLEADALARALPPADPNQEVTFDIVDAHRILASLGLHSGRLSRQFQKALASLREMQEDRRFLERRQLKEAADILIRHQRKGLAWNPADDGFVFSLDQIERHARYLIHDRPLNYEHDGTSPTLPLLAKTAI